MLRCEQDFDRLEPLFREHWNSLSTAESQRLMFASNGENVNVQTFVRSLSRMDIGKVFGKLLGSPDLREVVKTAIVSHWQSLFRVRFIRLEEVDCRIRTWLLLKLWS
jgi:hypothetical protein